MFILILKPLNKIGQEKRIRRENRKRIIGKITYQLGKSIRLIINCRTASLVNLAHNQDPEAVGGIVLDLLAEEDDDGDDDDVGAFLVVVLSVLVAE